jgi:hypothetical protein
MPDIDPKDIEIHDLRNQLMNAQQQIAELQKERDRAAGEMLDRVRASLREYPNGGGDIEIMREVERIVNEATAELQKDKSRADAAEGELHELDNLRLENHDQAIEIARLRERAEKDSSRLLFSKKVARSIQDELDRMRQALEDAPHASNCESMKRANVPMELCTCWKSRALNPEAK